jgi:hypothetical protein
MAVDWPSYIEALVMRGEILLDLGLLQSWGDELEEMNSGRMGGRYRYPDSFIRLQGFIRAFFRLPYRQLEGFTRALSRWEPRLVAPDRLDHLPKGEQARCRFEAPPRPRKAGDPGGRCLGH